MLYVIQHNLGRFDETISYTKYETPEELIERLDELFMYEDVPDAAGIQQAMADAGYLMAQGEDGVLGIGTTPDNARVALARSIESCCGVERNDWEK